MKKEQQLGQLPAVLNLRATGNAMRHDTKKQRELMEQKRTNEYEQRPSSCGRSKRIGSNAPTRGRSTSFIRGTEHIRGRMDLALNMFTTPYKPLRR
jgi:hypothetical protein